MTNITDSPILKAILKSIKKEVQEKSDIEFKYYILEQYNPLKQLPIHVQKEHLVKHQVECYEEVEYRIGYVMDDKSYELNEDLLFEDCSKYVFLDFFEENGNVIPNLKDLESDVEFKNLITDTVTDHTNFKIYCFLCKTLNNPAFNGDPEDSFFKKSLEKEKPILSTIEKVAQILNPLKEKGSFGTVILAIEEFEILVNTYVNWIDLKITPEKPKLFKFHGTNKEFFSPLKKLHMDLRLKVKGIGQVLVFHLLQNNENSDNGLQMMPGTIEKNINQAITKHTPSSDIV